MGSVPPQEGGHPSPFFGSRGRQGLRVSAAASVGPERCPPGTRTPRTPVRSWGFTPNPTTFEKVDETFTCLHPTCVEGPALAERKKAACPVRSRTLSAGIKASASQKTPPPKSGVRVMSRVATRQALGEKKLKFFPYPIPYEKGERPYAIPDLSGG